MDALKHILDHRYGLTKVDLDNAWYIFHHFDVSLDDRSSRFVRLLRKWPISEWKSAPWFLSSLFEYTRYTWHSQIPDNDKHCSASVIENDRIFKHNFHTGQFLYTEVHRQERETWNRNCMSISPISLHCKIVHDALRFQPIFFTLTSKHVRPERTQ